MHNIEGSLHLMICRSDFAKKIYSNTELALTYHLGRIPFEAERLTYKHKLCTGRSQRVQ